MMNHELIYLHTPPHLRIGQFETLQEEDFAELDSLARLMQKPDENFTELQRVGETDRKMRLVGGGLL